MLASVPPLANAVGLTGPPTLQKEVSLMKRIVSMVTLASVVALMMALSGPAFATIHPLANMECSNEHASSVANDQLPTGLSPSSVDSALTGKSQGSPPNNPTGSTLAQPVFAVSGGDPFTAERPSPAFKTFGANLEGEYCPANK
jgi:hypothetical protein